jgi:hypothetical protein
MTHHTHKKVAKQTSRTGTATVVLRTLLLVFLLAAVVALVVHEVRNRAALASGTPSTPSATVPATDDTRVPDNGVVVYGFRNTQRCASCITIENWTSGTLKEEFAPQLAEGTLIWRPLDVQQPENVHFVQDYQLTSISVVLVRYTNGKPGRWENLQNVWQLLGDQKAFHDYITSSTRSFLDSKE